MDTKKIDLRPNRAELLFLNLAYNKFANLFEEIMSECFWTKEASYRLMRTREAFSVYIEIIEYEPIKCFLKQEQSKPNTHEIGKETFKFIRNYLSHFPFFDNWNEIWIQKELINWNKPNQMIDKFLRQFEGKSPVKYRFWDIKNKEMTYISVNFPTAYSANEKIYLKDILCEKDGIRFSIIYMWAIIKTQVNFNMT